MFNGMELAGHISSKEKLQDRLLVAKMVVAKLQSLGIYFSDLMVDLPLIGSYFNTVKTVTVIVSGQRYTFKGCHFVGNNIEEITFSADDGVVQKIAIICDLDIIVPQKIENWKRYGILPDKFTIRFHNSQDSFNVEITLDDQGNIVMVDGDGVKASDLRLVLNLIEIAKNTFADGYRGIPLSINVLSEEGNIDQLFPDGGIILNQKYAI